MYIIILKVKINVLDNAMTQLLLTQSCVPKPTLSVTLNITDLAFALQQSSKKPEISLCTYEYSPKTGLYNISRNQAVR